MATSSRDGSERTKTSYSGAPERIVTTNTFRYTIITGTFDKAARHGQFHRWQMAGFKSTGDRRHTTAQTAARPALRRSGFRRRRSSSIELSAGMEFLKRSRFVERAVVQGHRQVTFEAEITTTRKVLTLDISGQMDIIKLGTVGGPPTFCARSNGWF